MIDHQVFRQGDGQTSIGIGVERGKVLMTFPNPITWAALDPENARQVAEAMGKAAYEAHYGMPPADGKSRIGEEIRKRLVTRVSLILRSMAEQGKSNGATATAVVDTILSEVL